MNYIRKAAKFEELAIKIQACEKCGQGKFCDDHKDKYERLENELIKLGLLDT